MKFLVIIGCLAVFLSFAWADSVEELKTLENKELDVKDLMEAEGDVVNSENHRKRDSGYSYPRPSRINFRNPINSYRSSVSKNKFSMRSPGQSGRPFNRYGPPNYPSRLQRPPQHKNKYEGHSMEFGLDFIQFPSNSEPAQMEVPSPIRNFDFSEPISSPIAIQNNEPFTLNSANYLPPKNQKPPINIQPGNFQQFQQPHLTNNGQFFSNQNFHQPHQNLIQNFQQDSQISDAALFLAQNGDKIAQLYKTPASNFDYPPGPEDFQNPIADIQNPNNQFQTLDVNTPTESEQLRNSQGFTGPIPPWSSGILETPRTFERIQSLEKDRIIVQLQQALATQSQAAEYHRYAQNYGQIVHNENSLSSIGTQTSPLDKPNNFNNQGHQASFIPSSSQGHGNFPGIYGVSSTGTQSTTSSSAINPSTTTSVHRPQDGASQGTLHPRPEVSPGVLSFPHFSGFVPSLIGSTNFATGLPSYGTSFIAPSSSNTPGQVSGSSPTHFGIPIPAASDTKPTNIGSGSSGKPIAKPPHTPVTIQPVYPLPATTPIQPIFPVVPAVSQPHPTYGLNPTLVNSLFVKPVKPVYPVYYYQNVAYQLQKPLLQTYPLNYAPTYTQTKPPQN